MNTDDPVVRGREFVAAMKSGAQLKLNGEYRMGGVRISGVSDLAISGGRITLDVGPQAPIGLWFDETCHRISISGLHVTINVAGGTGKVDGIRMGGDWCKLAYLKVSRTGDPGPRLYALHLWRARWSEIFWCFCDLGIGPGYASQSTDGYGNTMDECDATRVMPDGHGIGYDTHPAGIVGGTGCRITSCSYLRRPGDKSGAAFRVNGYRDVDLSIRWARECAIIDCEGAPMHLENVDGIYEYGCDVQKAVNVIGRVNSQGVDKLRAPKTE